MDTTYTTYITYNFSIDFKVHINYDGYSCH